jgi:Gas vesicle synthesis protein GvpO
MTADRTRSSKEPGAKAPAKRVRKAPAKKAPAKGAGGADETPTRASAPRAESKPRPSAVDVADRAVKQLVRLTGKRAEGVTGIERDDVGWVVTVEVLEVRRIPETTDVLARYEIQTDEGGDLVGYRRAGHYTRGSARED